MIQLLRQLIAREIGIRQALLALGHFFSIARIRSGDDFNWGTYHRHYREELNSIGRSATLILRKSDFEITHRALALADEVRLLPSHELLYRTVVALSPKSLLEVGCGGGDHLANFSMLLGEEAEVIGIDRSEEQLRLAGERHPQLVDSLLVVEVTEETELPRAELAYSHAVLMHISEKNGRFDSAVRNTLKAATKWVVMMENWTQHDYVASINKALGDLEKSWEVGYVRSSDTNAIAIVVSDRNNWPEGCQSLESTAQLLS